MKNVRALSHLHPPNSPLLADARLQLANSKAALRNLTRSWHLAQADKRDKQLHSVLSSDPRKLFSHIRSTKTSSTGSKIHALKVSGKIYRGEKVSDGFYDSLSSLKAPNMDPIHSSTSYSRIKADYDLIMKICSSGLKIPPVSVNSTIQLLLSLKPNVNDLNSITPAHYINAGIEGITHFQYLLNSVIDNINLSSLDELNSVWAIVLFKGHGKDRELDRSYRTISTCPVIAKALDQYIGNLFETGWAEAQAETQFQGHGSSHELAALLVTEVIQHNL